MLSTGIQETEINAAVEASLSKTEIILRQAESLQITTADEFQEAAVALREVASRRRDIDDERKRLVRPLDETRQRIQDLFRPALDGLARAEQLLKGSISRWNAEQDRLRRIAEAAAAEAARKESDRLAALAQRAAAAGKFEKAAALEGAADSVPIAEVAEPPKARGISTRESWKANVVDKGALVQAVADGKVPLDILDVNMSFLNQMARAMKGDLKWPGVEAVREDIVSARSGLPSGDYMPRRSLR